MEKMNFNEATFRFSYWSLLVSYLPHIAVSETNWVGGRSWEESFVCDMSPVTQSVTETGTPELIFELLYLKLIHKWYIIGFK